MFVWVCVFVFGFLATDLNQAHAADGGVYIVNSASAAIHSSPDAGARTKSTLNRGRRVQVSGPPQNGYLPLATKTGSAWVRASELIAEEPVAADVELAEPSPNRSPRRPAPRTSERSSLSSGLGVHRITFDLGASAGSYGRYNYTEINLGVNVYFLEWVAWRNALFARFPSEGVNIYGLDSSGRFIYSLSGGALGMTAFAGPGYRFANEGGSVPFAEGGLVLKLAGLSIGGGVKTLLRSWTTSGASNDTQYFIILAGGGSL